MVTFLPARTGEGVACKLQVGGTIVMRFGENALRVIEAVKAKLREVQDSLPPGVTIVPTYDRSSLVEESIATLRHTLIEEAVVVSIVIIVFLLHVRSALVPILVLPIAVLASFIPMYYLGGAMRAACAGDLGLRVWGTAAGMFAISIPVLALALRLMRRRLIR